MSNKQIICNKRALIDFLVYSYFGIVPEKIFKNEKTELYGGFHDYNDYCINKVIMAAYRDATNQGAYNTLFKKDLYNIEKLREASKEARNKSARFLSEKISDSENMKDGFDEWHAEVCKELVEFHKKIRVGDDNFFTYGNAQKWVNMTMKYLWMLGLLPEKIKEENLHIPIDSFVIDALWNYENVILPCFDQNKRNREYKQPSNFVIGWSKWKEENYNDLVKSIEHVDLVKNGKNESNLSWENEVWITQSEKRNKSTLEAWYD